MEKSNLQMRPGNNRPQAEPLTFTEDKQQFFKAKPMFSARARALAEANLQAKAHDYPFLSTHLFSIEEEFRHLHATLKRNESDNLEQWLYCYYCCNMLSEYYRDHHYNSPGKHAEYQSIANQIEKYCSSGQYPTAKLQTWKEQLWEDLDDLLSTPKHLSKIRSWIGFSNIYRIAFTFSRLTAQEFFLSINRWLSLLSRTLHFPLSLDEMNRKINGPTATFRALSVGLFIGRFLVNLSLVIKHTLFPTEGEKQLNISARFYQEMKKRYPQMLNDIVWATINGLTNYAEFFKIAAPLANGLLVSTLIFDLSLLAWRLREADKNYALKHSQYLREKKALQTELAQLLNQATPAFTKIKAIQTALRCLEAQMQEHELKIQSTRSQFYVNMVAASLLILALSTSLFLTTPALICVCYFAVVVGTALYISAESYGTYSEKRNRQEQLTLLGENTAAAKKETQQAWHNFVSSMVKNTVMPILIMGTLAVCWQAAVVLLVLYIAHEYANKYKKIDAAHKQQSMFEKKDEKHITARQEKTKQLDVETPNMLPA